MNKTKTIQIPELNGNGFTSIDAEYIGKGAFAKCYRVNNTVYSFVKVSEYELTDYSKEAVAEWASGAHVPDIKKLGYSEDENYLVYSMPYYQPLTAKCGKAWKQAKKLISIYNSMSSADAKTSCDFNQEFIESVRNVANLENGLSEIIEDLESLSYACSNYGSDYEMEFTKRNLKIDENGALILLDVMYNHTAITRMLQNRIRQY